MHQRPPTEGEPANLGVALQLAARGFAVFPVQTRGDNAKKPFPFFKWRDQSSTEERAIREWWRRWPDAAPALDLAKSNLLVVDADRHDPEHDGVAAWGDVMASHGFEPYGVPIVATPNEGCHFLFRQDGSLGNGRGGLPKGIDVRGAGGYVVAPGAIMGDGRFYECHGDPAEAPAIPEWLVKLLREMGGEGAAARDEVTTSGASASKGFGPAGPASGHHPSGTSLEEIEALLAHIPADCGYEEWVQALMAVHAATGGSSDGLALADRWSSHGSKYRKLEVARKWRSFRSAGINGATLAALAKSYGADLSAIRIAHLPEIERGPGTAEHGAEMAARLRQDPDGTLYDAETGEVVEEQVAAAPRTTDIPYPPGLVGDVARWIVATSWKPQPALAIGSALTIVGAAAGRQFMGPTNAGTALYVLGLAPTGQGKDVPLKQARRIFNAARMSMHLGPDEFMSFSSVVNVMKRRPLCLCPMDEFGDFMRRVYDRKGSVHARAIPKVLRTLWGANFDETSTAEWAEKESVPLHAPHLSIFGASTQEQFYSALESGAVADGTLNRFLIIEGARRPAKVKPAADPHQVPEWLVDGVRRVFLRGGEMSAVRRNDPTVNPAEHDMVVRLPWCADGAEEAFDAFALDVEERMIAEPQNVAFLARTVEMAVRIATIVAAGCERENVRVEDIRYGIELARQSAEMMITGAADYMAENEQEANWQKIIRLVRDAGGRIVYRNIQRGMRGMRGRDLRDLLAGMCEAEVLERQEVQRDGGGHPVIWYRLM